MKKHAPEAEIVPIERIAQVIHLIRGQKMMLDSDLADLYQVETKALNRAVRRNRDRFPSDFMFQLTRNEAAALRCQFGTSNAQAAPNERADATGRGGRRYLPYAFTEQGVAMLSSVLNSERAVAVNIAIMRAFVKLREVMEGNRALAQKFAELESRVGTHDEQINAIIEAIREMMRVEEKPRRRIGFHTEPDGGGATSRKRPR